MGSIKEQVYLEKLNQLKTQLQMLMARTHVDYVRQLENLRAEHAEAVEFNNLCRLLTIDRIERDCDNEKTAALREFEEKRAELRESLIAELEERRRQIEHEYQTMELTSDSIEVKPMKTRNLRRRGNDPTPVNDGKRPRKASPSLNLTLSNSDIAEDLKIISASLPPSGVSADSSAGSSSTSHRRDRYSPDEVARGNSGSSGGNGSEGSIVDSSSIIDVVIEDGKLIYQKKCYTRGQSVYVETTDFSRSAAVIQTIGFRDLSLRLSNGKRLHISLVQLQQGKCVLWRRP